MKRILLQSMLSIGCLAMNVCLAVDTPKTNKNAKDAPTAKIEAEKAEKPLRIVSRIDVEPVNHLSEGELREVSFASGRILKHVTQARDAIAENHNQDAVRHVDQALKLMKIVDGLLPHYKVKTQITSGDVCYLDEDDVTPRYVTLFEDVDRRDVISPVIRAKHEAGLKVDPTSAQKDPEGKLAPVPLVVTRADVTYTMVKLDVDLARRMLALASKHLGEDKSKHADSALHSLQASGVLLELEEIDLPLKQTADNLKLAEIEMKDGRHEEARAALQEAIDDLKDYEEQVGEKRGEEVKALHEEITKLAAELEKDKPSPAETQKLATTISRWRDSVSKWFTKKK
ncbi:MAG: YfdX family protein [Schlesneria sp.]